MILLVRKACKFVYSLHGVLELFFKHGYPSLMNKRDDRVHVMFPDL